MSLHGTLIRERTFHDVPGSSKKRIIENASQLIADTAESLDAEEIFAGLIGRERLGSTGLGEGVAIPHCRLDSCQETTGALVKLPEPIDFDAIDGNPVDLLFVLIVPTEATEAHLQTLAALAELFSQAEFREALRRSDDADSLYQAALSFIP
ncbi:MAG: PTS IIA-like nitrogen regulatory protein PtsN [Motiliproteus sp.]